MEAEERAFAEQLQKGLAVPEPPEALQRRLRTLAASAQAPPRAPLRRLSVVLAPALALACVVYVRAHSTPPPAPLPAKATPKTSPDPKHPKHLITPGVESIPEPGTLWLVLPGLLALGSFRFHIPRRHHRRPLR